MRRSVTRGVARASAQPYDELLAEVVGLLESARRAAARSVNAVMTANNTASRRKSIQYGMFSAVCLLLEPLRRTHQRRRTNLCIGFREFERMIFVVTLRF